MLIRKTILTLTALTVINAHADTILTTATSNNVSGCRVDHRCDIHGVHDNIC